MNKQIIAQQLATIKAVKIQLDNGYHISESDYSRFLDAVIAVQQLAIKVKNEFRSK